MLADVSVIDFCGGRGCFENVFLTGFLCPGMGDGGGGGGGEASRENGLGSSISPEISKYLSSDSHLSVRCCSFLGQKQYVSGKIHEYTVFIRCYPQRFILNCQGLQ